MISMYESLLPFGTVQKAVYLWLQIMPVVDLSIT